MKRIISLALTLSLLLTALLAVVPASAEETPAGELKVSAASLEFSSKVYLMVAVDYSELYSDYDSAKAEVTVTVTDKQGVETELLPDDSVSATEGFPENSLGFKLTSLGAKNMADQLTIRAYNGDNASGEPVVYSILEYAVSAKASTDDPALEYAIDCMLELGAEAQRAFEHEGDYPLYDEEGYIDYGMLVVYGGAQKKVFGKIGSELTPAASAAVGANAVLYDTSYDEIANNTVRVEGGVKKCFFVGDATRTALNLDMDKYTGEKETYRFYYDTENSKVGGAAISRYVTPDGSFLAKKPSVGSAMTDYSRLSIGGTATAAKPDWGFAITEPGALTVATGENGTYNFNVSKEYMPIRSDEEYTISVSIRAPKDLKSLGGNNKTISMQTATGMRFRNGYLWFYLWGVANNKFYLGATSSGIELGAVSDSEFTTFHIVVDVVKGTYTGYDADGNRLGECDMTVGKGVYNSNYATRYEDVFNADPKTFLTHSDTYLNWSLATANRALVLNRFTVTNGNIFE